MFCFIIRNKGWKYEYDFKFFCCNHLVNESNFDDGCKDYFISTEKIYSSRQTEINLITACKKKRSKNGKA